MNTTVPDKRNAPTLVIFWDPVGSPFPHQPLPRSQKMLCGTIKNLTSRCQLTGGYETVPGEIRGRLLKISYVAYTKKRNETLRVPSRSLTKKLSYSSQHSIGFTGMKCDANFSFLIILEKPFPLTGSTE